LNIIQIIQQKCIIELTSELNHGILFGGIMVRTLREYKCINRTVLSYNIISVIHTDSIRKVPKKEIIQTTDMEC